MENTFFKSSDEKLPIQVNVSHYNFDNYVDLPHWNSYWHQIVETKALNPQTVLIIGVGDNIVGTILENQGIKVYTFDIDKDLHPDFVGSITEIDKILSDSHFDVCLCCQVLEHIPYDKFESVLSKLRKISNRTIISLPYNPINITIGFRFCTWAYHKVNFAIQRYFYKNTFRGQHYWEIGKERYTKRKIAKSLKKSFMIDKTFLATYNHYHMFFILTNKQ